MRAPSAQTLQGAPSPATEEHACPCPQGGSLYRCIVSCSLHSFSNTWVQLVSGASRTFKKCGTEAVAKNYAHKIIARACHESSGCTPNDYVTIAFDWDRRHVVQASNSAADGRWS